MPYVDVHAHLDHPYIQDELDGVIRRAEEAGVGIIIANGISPGSNREVLKIAGRYSIVRAALGIYPPDAMTDEERGEQEIDIDEELGFFEENINKICAVGEIGLDYKYGKDKDMQKNIFVKQVMFAKEHDLPVIVHTRNAEEDTVSILEEIGYKKVVLHCFSGKKALVKKAADLGFYFSIPANVVRSESMQEIVRIVNINRLLTETDTPFLSPFKDKRNEPAFVVESVRKIAGIKGFDEKEVENNILLNYKRLFG